MVKIVGVKFVNGFNTRKTYRFKTDLDLQVNDYVVADTVIGYNVAKVTTLQPPNHGASRWIVDKFDADEHEKRMKLEKEKKDLLEKMKIRKSQLNSLEVFLLLSRDDEKMRDLVLDYLKLPSDEKEHVIYDKVKDKLLKEILSEIEELKNDPRINCCF